MRLFALMIVLLAAPALVPAQAAGSYSYEPSAGDLVNQAKKLIKKERYNRAIGKLKDALIDEPDNADIHNYLGFAYRKTGNTDKSGVHYGKALALEPDHKSALEYQGELFLTLGRLADAEGQYGAAARYRLADVPVGLRTRRSRRVRRDEAIAAHKAGR